MENIVLVQVEDSKMPRVSEELLRHGYTSLSIIKEDMERVILLINNYKKTYVCTPYVTTYDVIAWEDFVDLFL